MINIIIALVMFMFLVLVHEFGHFIVAKLSGIQVNEFSIGMGPSVANIKKKETLYSIRAIPLGGYVAMEGEDEASEAPNSYTNAKAYQKFLTILAGPLMNLLTAFLIFLAISTYTGAATRVVDEVLDDSPAMVSGLQVGDEILSVNQKNSPSFAYVSQYINESQGSPISLEVKRNGEKILISNIIPEKKDDQYLIGFTVGTTKKLSSLISEAFYRVIFIIQLLWLTLKQLFTGVLGLNAVSGPIGVISQVGQAANLGAIPLLNFLALISVNLAFFNLLPIPALDGSKLLFIAIEKIIGRKINPKFEQTITIVGFILLLGLIFIVSIKDVFSLFK